MNAGTGSTRVSRRLALAATLLACGLLSSCATLFGPRDIEVPLYKLQAGVERRFPVDDRFLELFDIHLSRPEIMLQPQRDRVALALSAEISPPFLRKSYNAGIEFSGHPYIDLGRNAVYMADARMDRFELEGVDEPVQRQLKKVANFVLDKTLRDMPVYSFRLEDLRHGGVQFVPARIRITGSSLVVTLEPVK